MPRAGRQVIQARRQEFPTDISYRAFPVPPGQLKRSALYASTDAEHPRK